MVCLIIATVIVECNAPTTLNEEVGGVRCGVVIVFFAGNQE